MVRNKTGMNRLSNYGKIFFIILIGACLAIGLLTKDVIPVQATTKVSLNTKKLVLVRGDTYKLKMLGTSKNVIWKSTDTDVITVNKKGRITAVKTGEAKVKAKVGGRNYKCKVTVVGKINRLDSLEATKVMQLKPSGLKGRGKITYISSDNQVASVNDEGTVTGKCKGKALIVAKAGRKYYCVQVTVTAHTHQYSRKVTEKATCDKVGVETFTCSCGDSYTNEIPAMEHDYVMMREDASCAIEGYKIYTCRLCDSSYKEMIPKTEHNYINHICIDCGDVDLVSVLAEQTGLDSLTIQGLVDSDEETSTALKTFYAKQPVLSEIGSNPNKITSNGSHAIRFQWTETSGANGYYYEIATDSEFENIVKTGNMYRANTYYTNSVTASITNYPDDDLYVRVCAFTGVSLLGNSYKFRGRYSEALKYAIADAVK